MKKIISIGVVFLYILLGCNSFNNPIQFSVNEKREIQDAIKLNLDQSTEATRVKDIEAYMRTMPSDLVIYDERGEIISREMQKAYALRDWAIIDTTLHIQVDIDSIQFLKKDSILVFTSQMWERMMFQRDGISTDTVLTTQRHRETWKKRNKDWFGFEVQELEGKIFINGELYDPK